MHWEDPEGWDGEGGGRGDQDGEHRFLARIFKKHCNEILLNSEFGMPP